MGYAGGYENGLGGRLVTSPTVASSRAGTPKHAAVAAQVLPSGGFGSAAKPVVSTASWHRITSVITKGGAHLQHRSAARLAWGVGTVAPVASHSPRLR
jgi:hypothetical protein